MQVLFDTRGTVRCLYGEAIDLRRLGRLQVRRASHVEPDAQGRWWADLYPVDGPRLGPFALRSEALSAETRWIESNLLERAARGEVESPPHCSANTAHTHSAPANGKEVSSRSATSRA